MLLKHLTKWLLWQFQDFYCFKVCNSIHFHLVLSNRYLSIYIFLDFFSKLGLLIQAAPGSFTPEIKLVDCPDEDSDLCLEVRFQTETDIAELDQKSEGDFSNYEGHFMNSGVRVFASMPEFNNKMMSVNSMLHVSVFSITSIEIFAALYLLKYLHVIEVFLKYLSIPLKIGLFCGSQIFT